tara:strand:- start:1120 stop:1227 length:108 start_codon:yes stop_codon:yes gene_type:complete
MKEIKAAVVYGLFGMIFHKKMKHKMINQKVILGPR